MVETAGTEAVGVEGVEDEETEHVHLVELLAEFLEEDFPPTEVTSIGSETNFF